MKRISGILIILMSCLYGCGSDATYIIRYELTGSASDVHITYTKGTEGFVTAVDISRASLPWQDEFRTTLSSTDDYDNEFVASITAQKNTNDADSMQLVMTINDRVVSDQSTTAAYGSLQASKNLDSHD